MIPEQMKNGGLDRLIQEALQSNDDLKIRTDLTDRTIRKLEKSMLLRELLVELLYKIGLILISLAALGGVLIWAGGGELLSIWYTQLLNNLQVVIAVLILVIFTILVDQVGLRYYEMTRKHLGLKA
ncbi:MAG: hypothetical protein JXA72_09890 [Bacteroidales bacterium]|nr:hypothetical protein [Bacteroidales bacterium]